MLTKTRKQGNSVTLTVPSDFNVEEGIRVEAKLLEDGIFYEFVDKGKDFYDFDEDILKDLVEEGYGGSDLIAEYSKRKRDLIGSIRTIAEETVATQPALTREELEKEIGL